MFPKSVLMFLVPARGTTTFHAQIGPKCSGAPSGGGSVPPCGHQDNSQTLEFVLHSLVLSNIILYTNRDHLMVLIVLGGNSL